MDDLSKDEGCLTTLNYVICNLAVLGISSHIFALRLKLRYNQVTKCFLKLQFCEISLRYYKDSYWPCNGK